MGGVEGLNKIKGARFSEWIILGFNRLRLGLLCVPRITYLPCRSANAADTCFGSHSAVSSAFRSCKLLRTI